MQYNGTMYRYVHNLQGDILAILDSAGNTVVQYAYDAWGGKKTTTGSMAGTLGYLNPFRYRGYVWDEETWMYYLRSRYYYPELQRFISADDSLGRRVPTSHNLFSYCGNQPIDRVDLAGRDWRDATTTPFSIWSYTPGAYNLERSRMIMEAVTPLGESPEGARFRQTANDAWNWIQQAAIDTGDFIKHNAIGFISSTGSVTAGGALVTLATVSIGGAPGLIIGLFIGAPVAFTGTFIGSTIQEDLNYDGRIDGKTGPNSLYNATLEAFTAVISSVSSKFGWQVLSETIKQIFKITDTKDN